MANADLDQITAETGKATTKVTTNENGPVVGRVSRLKSLYPGLKVVIALGGWVFNDRPTQTRFSDMASSESNRQAFITSLVAYMRKYALNGVDIGKATQMQISELFNPEILTNADWEYPVADDRGGIPQDFDNFVTLVSEIRAKFDSIDPGWELTMTLPASYWYLRGFNVKGLVKYVNWFNVMTYDIHGLWDQKNVWTGPFLKGHTNITEIEDGLDLLWRNGITPDKVVMGYGFYGRILSYNGISQRLLVKIATSLRPAPKGVGLRAVKLPRNCDWEGIPQKDIMGCKRGCGPSQFELTNDAYIDKFGLKECGVGSKSILQKCHWTSCLFSSGTSNCAVNEVSVATRYDADDGTNCKSQTGLGNGGTQGPMTAQYFRSYCCPKDDPLEDCQWSNDLSRAPKEHTLRRCALKTCDSGELEITEALKPSTLYELQKEQGAEVCDFYNGLPGFAPEYPLCCSPPSKFDRDWPVNPAYLWNGAHVGEKDDVSWVFADNFGNNNKDTSPTNLEENPGEDPYGFVMLDGPPGSIAKQFDAQFTVITRDEPLIIKPRSLVTTNKTVLDATFDHLEETVQVYCNHHQDSKHCNEVFYKGAKDTIIKLPDHVGEGPYARIVSMEPMLEPTQLPPWAIRKRTEQNLHGNGIYKLVFDYDFHAIKREEGEEVFMRVDYTNLQKYWGEITDEDPKNWRKKRSEQTNFQSWKARVDKAKNAPNATLQDDWKFSTRGKADFSPEGPISPAPRKDNCTDQASDIELTRPGGLVRRGYGPFLNWFRKLTTITKEEAGVLPM
ncbi:putative endochitinase [Glarea lozoyensis 74030]|uniref:chitinase n=1 Tax=Glarea lozoyensis (strain ATCC 74030 / MF5533) TaxID=1104152 RepID=H0EHY9_GLAL7|nr:putative endochitinase [Glarea lozoyensis 74030]